MAVEYKEITQLEKLDALADGSYILVVEDGTAKLISKENAKFGGGGITTFYLSEPEVNSAPSGGSPVVVQSSDSNSEIATQATASTDYIITHEDGTAVTAQEAYDAYVAGGVRLRGVRNGVESFNDVVSMAWTDSSGASNDPSDVVFVYLVNNAVEVRIGQVIK